MAGAGKELVLTYGAAISDLDGIHTLTCALMLLNTDLHGHVSWGSPGGDGSSHQLILSCPSAVPSSSPLPETSCLTAMFL